MHRAAQNPSHHRSHTSFSDRKVLLYTIFRTGLIIARKGCICSSSFFGIIGAHCFAKKLESNIFSSASYRLRRLNSCSHTILFQKTLHGCISHTIYCILTSAQILPVLHFLSVRQLNVLPSASQLSLLFPSLLPSKRQIAPPRRRFFAPREEFCPLSKSDSVSLGAASPRTQLLPHTENRRLPSHGRASIPKNSSAASLSRLDKHFRLLSASTPSLSALLALSRHENSIFLLAFPPLTRKLSANASSAPRAQAGS